MFCSSFPRCHYLVRWIRIKVMARVNFVVRASIRVDVRVMVGASKC